MTKKVGLALVAAVMACGCNAARDAEIKAAVSSAREACREQGFKTQVEKARCMNDAEAPIRERVPGDLAAVRAASRVALAEKVDKKQMTVAEAELEFAQINSSLASQASDRVNQDRRTRAAIIGAINAGAPTTCIRNGNVTNCF